MTISQIIVAVFALIIFGLMLPLPTGARMALWLALIVMSVMTFIGGGMHYVLSMFQ